ncbi:hypothetical protein CPB85DRAFT_909723 [Mucidula mucida]|nr:hypothetical protein CPB85DRAFT_909723 [Mucidula mucida]
MNRLPMISFEYPITRPLNEHWHYANHALLAFGLVNFALFITLNSYLVGYDVVSVNKADYNASDNLPWLASLQSKDYSCQPHTFQLGDVFRTNVSAFSYDIYNIRTHEEATTGFQYANSYLKSCDVTQTAIQVSPGDRAITVSAAVYCPEPLNFEATTSWTYSNHFSIGSITADLFGNNTIPRALLNAMNAFADEAYEGIYFGLYHTSDSVGTVDQPIRTVFVEALPTCDTTTSSSCTPVRPHVAWTFIEAIGQTDLQIVGNTTTKTLIDMQTLYNLLEVFYHAVRIDLGRWSRDNIFTNTTAFNTSVTPYVPAGRNDSIYFDAAAAARRQAFRDTAKTQGMLSANATTPTPEAIIHMQYTCNTLRRKTAGSWFISVLSATLSMFLTVWGLVVTVFGCMARRRPAANQCSTSHGKELTLLSTKSRDSNYDAEDLELRLLPPRQIEA